jgi:hypothetical protein
MGIDEVELCDDAFEVHGLRHIVVRCDPVMSKARRALDEEQ